MESEDEQKEVEIKNHTCYYFDFIMRFIDIDFSDILLNKKLYKTYENTLIYDISYKTFMCAKPFCIWFKKIYGFIKIYDRIRRLVVFGPKRLTQLLIKRKVTTTIIHFRERFV